MGDLRIELQTPVVYGPFWQIFALINHGPF